MKKVYIIYRSFFDLNGNELTIGGIQTYIRQLIQIIKSKNYIPIIVQYANCNFKKQYEGVEVYGIDVKNISKERKKSKKLLNFIKGQFNEDDILIFASEDIYSPSFTNNTIAIQHGITWDVPKNKNKMFMISIFRKFISSYLHLIRTRSIKNLVCVDYNYINWIRTQLPYVDKNLFAIPNCTSRITKNTIKSEGIIKIIFARRFETYRGTRLFSNVIIDILKEYSNVHITFAGKGPEEHYLNNLFKDNPQVDFITYKSEESLEIHKDYHIAVIPTLGSEGTSLSLLEAMISSCAVIATNVGGMTNIIIDRYNGRLISPQEKELKEALKELIDDKNLREFISKNAYDTVYNGFNKEIWEEKWSKVLESV